jgi:predicted RNA methylase
MDLVGRLLRRLQRELAHYHPRAFRSRRDLAERDARYDDAYHVDTGGDINLKALAIFSPNRRFGTKYSAIPPEEFARGMAALSIRHEDFTFIDFGSGKGRALLLASDFPFRKLIGIEFARELHEAAATNLRNRTSVQLLCMDVVEFEFPQDPLVVFLYNPFGPEIISQVAHRLYRSFAANRRPVYVLYLNPFHLDPWLLAGFRVLRGGDPFVILCPQ